MAKRNKRSRQKARTPTIQNSGYSNGGASHESNILKAYNPRKYSAKSDVNANLQPQRRPIHQYAHRGSGYHDQFTAHHRGGVASVSASQVQAVRDDGRRITGMVTPCSPGIRPVGQLDTVRFDEAQ